jgi:hypothetical protein
MGAARMRERECDRHQARDAGADQDGFRGGS